MLKDYLDILSPRDFGAFLTLFVASILHSVVPVALTIDLGGEFFEVLLKVFFLNFLVFMPCLQMLAKKGRSPLVCSATAGLLLVVVGILASLIGNLLFSSGYPLISVAEVTFFFNVGYLVAFTTWVMAHII